ncbi:MAG: arsenite methyltransferase [Anaerolineales bacterium]|nr:arsenite methyltransferase [Anaerolineales bacterium]
MVGDFKFMEEEIRRAVTDHYTEKARSADPCCGSGEGAPNGGACCGPLYDPVVLGDMPEDVTGGALGCGDPVTLAGLQSGEVVLDLGSGGGLDCFLAAELVGEEGRVIGVDMTEDMIARARCNKEKLGMENVEFRLGQIESLPVEEGTVDVILSNCVINLAPDKAPVFREAYRVLKPGGRISISDIVAGGPFPSHVREDPERWAECITGAIELEDYLDWMRAAGFEDVRVTDKVSADDMLPENHEGMPPLFSARIQALKSTREG